MSTTAYERLIDALRDHGSDVKDNGHGKAQAQCPAHDDNRSSLSIGPRKDGKGVVVYCHAGCTHQDVLGAIGWTTRDLFDEDGLRRIYNPTRDYCYPDGRRVHRKPDKTFPQSGNMKDRSLFHGDRIGDATTFYVTEGEKDERVDRRGHRNQHQRPRRRRADRHPEKARISVRRVHRANPRLRPIRACGRR